MFLFNLIIGSSVPPGIPADGTILYCAQDTTGLLNPYSPIPADGTIIYCTQDTTGLPTP